MIPCMETWKNLYELAIRINELSPWEWMDEREIFGIQNPWTSEMGYFCIIGSKCEHRAIVIYIGAQGVESLLNIQDDVINHFDAYVSQLCLFISFQNKTHLKKTDLDLMKRLGIKIKGSNGFPMFRFHSPGYDPESIDDQQAEYLTIALEKAIDVCSEADSDNEFFLDEQGRVPVYIPSVVESGVKFTKELVQLSAFMHEYESIVLGDKEIMRMKKKAKPSSAVWSLDYFYLRARIKEKGKKPYYPRAVMITDEATESILKFKAFKEDLYLTVTDELVGTIGEVGILPKQLKVRRLDLYKSIGPVANKLGIALNLVSNLSYLDDIKEHLETAL